MGRPESVKETMPTIPLSSRILRDLQIMKYLSLSSLIPRREILVDSEQLDGPESHGGGGKRKRL